MISAILRAQFLSMRLRGGARRGGAIFGALTGLLFYSVWALLAWGVMLFFSSPDQAPLFVPGITGGLMFVMLYWQLAPVISASFGASLDLQKLLAYPIPLGKLFLVEVLLRVVTCGEMLLLLIGLTAGLLRNPVYGLHAAPMVLAGALLFSAMNILLSAGTRSLVERLFLRTRLREAMLLLLVLVSVLPRLLIGLNVRLQKQAVLHFVPSQSAWPWAGAARLMLGDSLALSAAAALGWLAVAFFFSRWQFQRSLRFDAGAGRSRRIEEKQESGADSLTDRVFRTPARFFPDPFAALAEKELRTLSRIPRFRLVYIMSCLFGAIIYLPNMRRAHPDSFWMQNAVVFMALYALLMLGQITYWNSFGFDRTATQGYFSWPIRFRDVLIAKNLTVLFLLVPQILLVSATAAALRVPLTPVKILETIVVIFVAALYWLALGNSSSVRMPRALDSDKMNQMSNRMQSFTILLAPLLLLPLVLAYWARWFFANELVFAGLVLVAGIVGGIFYGVGLDSAVQNANSRREKMLMELSRSDGPMSLT